MVDRNKLREEYLCVQMIIIKFYHNHKNMNGGPDDKANIRALQRQQQWIVCFTLACLLLCAGTKDTFIALIDLQGVVLAPGVLSLLEVYQ